MLWVEILSPFCSENRLLSLFASSPKVFTKRCYSRTKQLSASFCAIVEKRLQTRANAVVYLTAVCGIASLGSSLGCYSRSNNHCGCQSGGASNIWQLLLSRDHESILHCKQLKKKKRRKKSSFALPFLKFSLWFDLFFWIYSYFHH